MTEKRGGDESERECIFLPRISAAAKEGLSPFTSTSRLDTAWLVLSLKVVLHGEV